MNRTSSSLLALAALAVAGTVQAYPVKLVSYIQVSDSGNDSTLRWDGCTDYAAHTNCIKPGSQMANAGITPSTATWDWNPTTGVLSSVGDFNAASSVGSNAASQMVIGDTVTNLTINTATMTNTATAYECIEGQFLGGVGAQGCANTSTGGDFTNQSSMAYNVGGVATCAKRTIGGDDSAMDGNPRGLVSRAAGGGCDATDGAYNMWTILEDNTGSGGRLIISNGIPIHTADSAYLTFDVVPYAVDDAASALPTVAMPIDVLANDVALTDPVTVAIGTAPTQGTATVAGSPGNKADVRINYTANAGATGTDTFTYTVTSGATTTSPATVTVTILAGGANDDTATTTRNKPVTINVGGNDTGFTDPVTVSQVGSCSQGGTFAPGAAGPAASATITYTPSSVPGTPTYTETCTYQITDGSLTDNATVTVTVNNTVPVANAGQVSVVTKGVDPSTVNGALNVASISGNALGDAPATVTATAPGKGTVTVAAGATSLTYTPNANFFAGSDTFDYTITDSDGDTATGTVTVDIPDAIPALAGLSLTTSAGQTSAVKGLTITAGNGSIAQHGFAVTTNGTGGSCSVTSNSIGAGVTYTPNAGFSGTDNCVVTVTDGDGSTGTGNITVTVNPGQTTGGDTGNALPGGSGAGMGLWSLALLGGAGAWARRKRKAA